MSFLIRLYGYDLTKRVKAAVSFGNLSILKGNSYIFFSFLIHQGYNVCVFFF